MAEEIIWSPLAIETFDAIINYLIKTFGETSAVKFIQKTNAKLSLIQSRPNMFRKTGK